MGAPRRLLDTIVKKLRDVGGQWDSSRIGSARGGATNVAGSPDAVDGVEIVEVSPDEALAMLDEATRRHLDMSGEDFAQAWQLGKFEHPTELERRLSALLPLVEA